MTRPFVSDLVIRALEHIRIHAELNTRVSDLANHLGVARRWEEKRLEQTIKRSIMDEIQRVRIETLRALVGQRTNPSRRSRGVTGSQTSTTSASSSKKRFCTTMTDFRATSRTGAKEIRPPPHTRAKACGAVHRV